LAEWVRNTPSLSKQDIRALADVLRYNSKGAFKYVRFFQACGFSREEANDMAPQ
jgi:hypothetical protein